MKNFILHIKKGIIVYTTIALQKINQLSIEKLKSNPKEAFVSFSDILSVSTKDMPDNWISIKIIDGDKTYYEDRSISNFIKTAKRNNVVFQKITGKLALNICLFKYKSNLSVVELINGDTYTVNRHYKGKLKTALLSVWEE
jgi:hypothetical protein